MVAKNESYVLPIVTPPTKDAAPIDSKKPAKQLRAVSRPVETKPEKHPWEDIPEEATQTYVVALPAKLHCKLKWIGGMTWGSSMRKIVIEALEVEAKRLLKAKGIGTD